jgi:hypothetical protein
MKSRVSILRFSLNFPKISNNLKLTYLSLFLSLGLSAQNVAINSTGDTAHPSALLDLQSTNRGFLPPRMTTSQRDAITNPAVGLLIFNISTNCLNMYYGTSWREICETYREMRATGGTITEYIGNGTNGTVGVTYRVHTFTSSGTFQVTNLGSSNGQVDYLVVAGGGGGGTNGGGGGGAGGVRFGSVTIPVGNQTIAVGNGGSGSNSAYLAGSNGQNSSLGTLIVSTGGGAGASRDGGLNGQNGGSGGGGGGGRSVAGLGTVGQGNNGGNGTAYNEECNASGGGGGGANGSGVAGASMIGGNGGEGIAYSITGTSVFYGGGGGGGRTCNDTTRGTGGNGGGGNGGGQFTSVQNGTPNTGGGGGGGGCCSATGGNGGSGIVIIRYPITNP